MIKYLYFTRYQHNAQLKVLSIDDNMINNNLSFSDIIWNM